jgi:hypothetical protein
MTADFDCLELLKIILPTAAFALALYQYIQAQRWKRLEFTAAEIAKFRADPSIKKVLLLLDWPLRPMTLDSAQGLLDPPTLPSGAPLTNVALLHKALALDIDCPTFTRYEAALRDHFDVFLDFLCHFENCLKSGLIKQSEIEDYLEYWTKALAGKGKLDRSLLTQLWRFADFYGYAKARLLVQRYYPTLATDFPGIS